MQRRQYPHKNDIQFKFQMEIFQLERWFHVKSMFQRNTWKLDESNEQTLYFL